MNMMRLIHSENVHSQQEAKEFFGHTFSAKFSYAPSYTNEDICDFIMRYLLKLSDANRMFERPQFKISNCGYWAKFISTCSMWK